MVETTTIGFDIAKQIFQVHGVSADNKVTVKRRLRRSEVLGFFRKLARCIVGLEACGGSHYWAREISALGHDVRLMPPSYVKPYVKRGKTDAVDAEAICEAVSRPTMRFVPIKTEECQAAVMVLKTRDLLVRQRTQAINALRGHLTELGIVAARGVAKVEALIEIIRDENDSRLPPAGRTAIVVVSPAYFAGAMNLGGLMQTGTAFGSVQTALSFFVTSYRQIAEWRAVIDRLAGFEAAIAAGRALADAPHTIKLLISP